MTEALAGLPADIVVECPACRAAIAVRGDLPHRAARCPLCGGAFLIPMPRLPTVTGQRAPREETLAGMERGRPDETPSFSLPEPPGDPPAADPPTTTGSAEAAPRPRGELEFQEPVKTIETRAGVVRLRRLSPEEKHARRTRRNLVMLCGGATILFLLVFFLGRGTRRR